jgi:hypothetical protein
MWKRTPKAILHGRDSIIKFGKHKDRTVQEVLDDDPDYLVWASERIPEFDLEVSILDEALHKESRDFPASDFDLRFLDEIPY